MGNRTLLIQHPFLTSVISGVGAHVICHFHPPASLTAFAAVLLGPPGLILALSHSHSSIWQSVSIPIIYLCSLALSITAYRLSPFHPLANYPGPILARVSRLWAAWGVFRGRQNIDYHELFLRYGDIVRTGPDHLIIRDASVIPAVHGSKDRWPRHARYQVHLPYNAREAILELNDIGEHAKRRRLWDRAFTSGAIKSYEPMLQVRLAQLMDNLDARKGQSLDLSAWIGFFSLDFMGDFAFGGAFELLNHGDDYNGVQELVVTLVSMIEFFGTIPWIRPLLNISTPPKVRELQQITLEVARRRVVEGSQVRDLFHYLLSEDGDEDVAATKLTPAELSSEAMLAIGAGSDTTATAILNTVFYLITYPSVFARLRQELDECSDYSTTYDQPLDPGKLADLKYLQAIINETLRLQPAVPNGVQRTTPRNKGPVSLAHYVIPPETTVQLPTWSIHRDSRNFAPDPESFWPERWIAEEGPKIAESQGQEFRLLQGAYMPFHYGPANCAGRALALHEMRTVIASLVRRFDIAFAPGYEAKDWIDQLKDRFLLNRGQLRVIVTTRA